MVAGGAAVMSCIIGCEASESAAVVGAAAEWVRSVTQSVGGGTPASLSMPTAL